MRRSERRAALCGALLSAALLSAPARAHSRASSRDNFVRRAGHHLKVRGAEFRFVGANNYYLPYKSAFMVDDVLLMAQSQGFTVMRTWGFIDIGNADGTNSVSGADGRADGVYFHYWDGTAPAFNDGPSGLEHLDYVLYRAGQLGVRLVIPLVNNWENFGGMDQYVRWAGGQFHDQFYTDSTIRGWFKDWASHLLNRVNTYTGVAYKDDPTIMAWDLANEPRCKGSNGTSFPTSPTCTAATLTGWADEMSRFIKTIDRAHLVSVGDEGFYCDPASTEWTENCGEGVDTVALAALPKVDLASMHLYLESWNKSPEWGTTWIERHVADALALDKPAMLGEFGAPVGVRNAVYKQWIDTMFAVGGAGSLVWMLAGQQDDGTLYPSYDGFNVYCPSAVCSNLSHLATMMSARHPFPFAPVADDDSVTTEFGTPVVLGPVANDVAYGSEVALDSIDLDPGTRGQQFTLALPAGRFDARADGTVLFTPAAGAAGQVTASYVVSDGRGRRSNQAALKVTVKADPATALLVSSFETSNEGWAPQSGPAAGATAQTATFATQGTHAIEVTATTAAWFGAPLAPPIDLSQKTQIKWDLTTLAGTSQLLALVVGDAGTWCQATGSGWVNANTTATMAVDLSTLSCGPIDLSQVRAIYVYMGNGGGGTFYLDNVRAE